MTVISNEDIYHIIIIILNNIDKLSSRNKIFFLCWKLTYSGCHADKTAVYKKDKQVFAFVVIDQI